jgi:hypothetical protein
VDDAQHNEKLMSDAFEVLSAEAQKTKETWKRNQSRLVAELEHTNEENARLK